RPEMFLPFPRVRGAWVALVLVALTPLSAIAVSPVKKFPKCCVWRVINAEAPVYLVGSIHALDKNDYPLPSPYEVALRNSTRFVFEFDPNRAPEFERKFEAAAKYPPGQDIRSKIDPALLRWLRQNIFTLKTDPREGKRPRVAGFDSELWAGDARLRNQAPRIAARFVDDRNVKWIPRIEAELKTGKPTAIVAGALHFSGLRSVIALLQQRGYQIEQL